MGYQGLGFRGGHVSNNHSARWMDDARTAAVPASHYTPSPCVMCTWGALQGACQADVAILLVSARKGEFETGFDRGGQTREHAQLAKTLGVSRLIVVVNKLDCPSVALPGGKWDKGRFDTIVNGLTPFLRQCGYNMKKEVGRGRQGRRGLGVRRI